MTTGEFITIEINITSHTIGSIELLTLDFVPKEQTASCYSTDHHVCSWVINISISISNYKIPEGTKITTTQTLHVYKYMYIFTYIQNMYINKCVK